MAVSSLPPLPHPILGPELGKLGPGMLALLWAAGKFRMDLAADVQPGAAQALSGR